MLYSLTEGHFNLLERESNELKNVVDELQSDIDKADENKDDTNEQVKTLKENAITALKTMGVLSSGAGQDDFGIDLAEYLLLEKQELRFARQSTLQKIITDNTNRLIEVSIPKSASDIKSIFVDAMNSFAIKNEASFSAECDGALTEFYEPLDTWFKNLESALSGTTEGENAFFAYEANISTVFLRYMANASGTAGFEVQPGKVHTYVTGKAEAKVDLIRCKADTDIYVPSTSGLELEIPPIPAEWQDKPTLKLADEFVKMPPAPLILSDEELKELNQKFPYENNFPRVNFDFDSSFLKPTMLNGLVKLERLLKENTDYKVQIVGHTDLVGGNDYNMSLSERRARSVLAYVENDAAYWEKLYSDLEREQWGLPVLKTILIELLKDKRAHMTVEQRGLYATLKPILSRKDQAHEFSSNFQKGLELYFDLYAYRSRYSALEETPALRLQLFADYMRLHGDVLITRGRFHSRKLMFLGEGNPDEPTQGRSVRNRRVEFWLYRAYNTDENFAHLGYCRIHLSGEAQGWAGASAAAAIELDAKVDATQLQLTGIERTARAEEQTAKPMRIAARSTAETDHENSDKVKLNEDPYQWGLTRETEQSNVSNQRFEYAMGNDRQTTQGVLEHNQETKRTQSESLYWDDESNSLVREKKKETRTSESITWREETRKKVNSVIPDEVANAGAAASLSAFAGAKAEAKGAIALEWASEEADKSGQTSTIDQDGQAVEVKNDGFLELAKAGGGVEGWAGAGADVDFAVRLSGEEILVRTKLAAAVGLGAGVAVDMQVAPVNIYNMLMFMYDQLRKADYSFLPYIAQEAWQQIQYAFTKYLQYGKDGLNYAINEAIEAGEIAIDVAGKIGTAIGEKVEKEAANIQRWWAEYEDDMINAAQVADNIARNPHGLRFAPPDVKARLITSLLVEYDKHRIAYRMGSTGEKIERAIMCILTWVQSKREFEKVLQRVGVKPPMRPNKEEERFIEQGRFIEHKYETALIEYDEKKRTHAKIQKSEIETILDFTEDTHYFIWLNRYLPEETTSSGLIEANAYLKQFYGDGS
ncbi:ompA family protein [Reinekea sp. MED297]|uniref:OmpA family protein n=1 Tax=Reinekea blandensis MED297 TaxID=314283 RepID=A4BEU9_9GAMM|nr:ompA family protein [Reinekea sp. MED297] [Reinekea blandensis MED297]